MNEVDVVNGFEAVGRAAISENGAQLLTSSLNLCFGIITSHHPIWYQSLTAFESRNSTSEDWVLIIICFQGVSMVVPRCKVIRRRNDHYDTVSSSMLFDRWPYSDYLWPYLPSYTRNRAVKYTPYTLWVQTLAISSLLYLTNSLEHEGVTTYVAYI